MCIRYSGKVVLIDFWASWFPPCRKEMPHLVELYKQYKNKGFEIVGISLDSKPEAWAKGVKDLNITWTQLSDLKGWQTVSYTHLDVYKRQVQYYGR